MYCRRNRISFVSFVLRVSLIWRLLLVWSCRKNRICGFQSPLTFDLGLSYLYLVSSVHVTPHRFESLPSYFFLRVLSKWQMLSIYFRLSLVFCLIIVLAWHFTSLGPRLFLLDISSVGNKLPSKINSQLVWSWRNHRSWGFLSQFTFHFGLSYLYLDPSVRVDPHLF